MKKLTIIIVISLLYLCAYGQPTTSKVKDAVMAAPNAAALNKFGNIPVSLYVGTPNVSVPVYNIQEGPLNLPISLNYHASGVRVAETASSVGIGWSLQAGGMITRTTQGTDDDKATYGFYHHSASSLTIGDPLVSEYLNGNRDAEPDIFNFNFAGYSGKFFFDKDQNYHFVPKQDLKLETNLDNANIGTFKQFTIITPDGTKYYFGKDPVDNNEEMEFSVSNNESYPKATASSWYITRIESHDSKYFIKFTYEGEAYSFVNPASRKYTDVSYSGNNCNGSFAGVEQISLPNYDVNHHYVKTEIVGRRLSQITCSSATMQIDFIESVQNREDLTSSSLINATFNKLDEIQISSGTYCSKFKLSHDYYHDKYKVAFTNYPFAKRLRLLSVQEIDCSTPGTPFKPPYSFEYHDTIRNGVPYLPHRLNKGIDHWGYYNGADGSNNLVSNNESELINIPSTSVIVGNQPISYGDAHREVNYNYAKYGTIKKVTYPTGGHSSFTFESNGYFDFVQISPTEPMLTLTNLDCTSNTPITCCNSATKIGYETFTNSDSPGDMHFRLNLGSTGCSPSYKARIDVYRVSNNSYVGGKEIDELDEEFWFELTELQQNDIFYNNNVEYKFILTTDGGIGTFNLEERPTGPGTAPTGGLRIKEVKTHDGADVNKDIIRTYSYLSENDQESGRLLKIPAYGLSLTNYSSYCVQDELNTPVFFAGALFFEQSIVPLNDFEGRHVAYSRVIESLNGNGHKIYKYHVINKTQTFSYPVVPDKLNPYNGQPIYEQVWDENYNQLKAATNTTGHADSLISEIPQTLYKLNTPVRFGPTVEAYLHEPYKLETRKYRTAVVEEVVDDVSTVTDYEYDDTFPTAVYDFKYDDDENRHYFPTKISSANSDGEVFSTDYTYVFSNLGTVYQEMKDRNMIANPILVGKRVNGVQVDGNRTYYDFFDSNGLAGGNSTNPIYPTLIQRYEATFDANGVKSSNIWDDQINFLEYDMNVGKPRKVQQPGWQEETYTWNVTNKLIEKREFENFEWIYNYHPNTRLVSEIIDIDGQDTDFTYDQLMRLKTVNARDGTITTDYTYHFDNDGTGIDKNYVKTRTVYPLNGNNPESSLDWTESWQYLDGLGRPLQTVQRRHATNFRDVITGAVEYDNQGRVSKQFEPFTGEVNTGAYTAIPPTQDFTLTTYYPSPLNRVNQVTPPDWNYPTTTVYGINNSSVTVDNTTYAVGSLNTVTTTDPEGLQTITYTDKRGRTVLSEQKEGSNLTSTRTIYDDKDRVRSVLPPGVTAATSALSYQYEYDGADNITRKFIPDMGWTDYRYDVRNLLTASRDPHLVSENRWLNSVYDEYGRVIETGFSPNNSGNPSTINHSLTTTKYDKDCGQTANIYWGKMCQSRTRILTTNDWLEENLTYDNFGRLATSTGNNHLNLSNLGAENTTFTYDAADNITQTVRAHQAFGSTQEITERMTIDHVGRLVNTFHQYGTAAEKWISHQKYTIEDELQQKQLGVSSINNALQLVDYEYLSNGFLSKINPSLTGNDLFKLELNYDQAIEGLSGINPQKNGNISQLIWQVQGSNEKTYGFNYDFLNRLTLAKSGTFDGSRNSITDVNDYRTRYEYDERGNITRLVRAGQYFNNTGYGLIDSLNYTYSDPLSNQLTNIFEQTPGIQKNKGFKPGPSSGYLYDENGNLISDTHKNMSIQYNYLNLPETINFAGGNQIVYLYDATGKKLQKKVSPDNTGTTTLNQNPIPSDTYQDNEIHSAGNVPNGHHVVFKGSSRIRLNDGFKGYGRFRGENTGTIVQDYCSGIEYHCSILEAIYHSEGRLYFEGDGERYEYTLADHLGNTRVTFADIDGNGFISASTEILQENHYYPFGLAQEGNWTVNTGNPNDYLYNGKELDTDFGLNWYHYGARMYDPAIGRFPSIDRFAEKFATQSPFVYGGNNPIKNIDINGDSVWVSTNNYTDKSGNKVFESTLNVTGKILDLSSANGGSISSILSSFLDEIGSLLNGRESKRGKIIERFNLNASFSIAESMDDVGKSDHLLALVDKTSGEDGNAAGIAMTNGKIGYIENSGNVSTQARVAGHEFLHNLGLGHNSNGIMKPELYPMSLTPSLSVREVRMIHSKARRGSLNKGENFENFNKLIFLGRSIQKSSETYPFKGNPVSGMKTPKSIN